MKNMPSDPKEAIKVAKEQNLIPEKYTDPSKTPSSTPSSRKGTTSISSSRTELPPSVHVVSLSGLGRNWEGEAPAELLHSLPYTDRLGRSLALPRE